MTDRELQASLRRLYLLTGLFTAAGTVAYLTRGSILDALGFLIGAAGSFVNLWVFNWLSRAIAPAQTPDGRTHKPWGAGLFIGRYAGLWVVGYGTVKLLGVGPLPVLLGLLASTVAVLASSIFDLIASMAGSRSST
jgi:hypothetical protein